MAHTANHSKLLESPPCLIGMDIMRPLRVRIDVTNGTATPAQPDPQTVHINAAQQQQQRMKEPLPRLIPPAIPPLETALPAAPPAPVSPAISPPSATPHTASRALLLQTAEIPAETAHLVRCHNPWPTVDVYFCPEEMAQVQQMLASDVIRPSNSPWASLVVMVKKKRRQPAFLCRFSTTQRGYRQRCTPVAQDR